MNESDEYVERLNKIKIPIDKRAYKKQKKESSANIFARSKGRPLDYDVVFRSGKSKSTNLAALMVRLEDVSKKGIPSSAIDSAEEIAELGYGSSRKVRNLLVKSYENMIGDKNYQNNKTRMGSPEKEKIRILAFLREHSTRESSGLEKITAIVSVLGILGGIFFLSSNITGNAIVDLTIKTSSVLSIGLFLVSLIAGFFWFKERKKFN